MSEFKNRPGDALESLIPEWAVEMDKSNCGCHNMKKAMNQWGTKMCEKKRDYLVRHLLSQEEHLVKPLRYLPQSVKEAAARRLVDKAIKLSSQ